MTTVQLAALSTELRTQDNACTAHPLYCVYDHHLTGRRKGTAPKDNWRFITACPKPLDERHAMITQRERTERAIAKRLARVQASIQRHFRCCREPSQQLRAVRDPLWFRIDAMATQGLTTKEGYSACVS